MASDVIENHVRRLPPPDPVLWAPRGVRAAELEHALLRGRVAGPATHPLDNVRGNAQMLLDRDPDKEFGLQGLQEGMDLDAVLGLVERAAGAPIDREARSGAVLIEPAAILEACAAAAPRLALARERGERVVLATGHPTGLAHLYLGLARWLAEGGADVRTPGRGARWRDERLVHDWVVEGYEGVVMLTDTSEPRHTHWPYAMHRVLHDERPDLVFADHGFAGAAIEAGVETISIADVNDPALLVAQAHGRTEHVLVFDDHVAPQDYWPVFVALTS
ncbi:MAG: phosphatase [Actinomycetota bacterium]